MTGKTIYTWGTDQDDQYLYVDRDIEGRWSVTIYRGDEDYPQEVGSIRLPEDDVRALHEWLARRLGLAVEDTE